jgi:precorrin-2 dehydrogenase/sirohydrochlorin ferrochelatase
MGIYRGLFIFSATNSREVNAAVFKEASQLNIFINAVDDPENCSFFVPSFFTKGDLLVAVSTGGASPSYAAKIRRLLERSIPENAEAILRSLRLSRDLLKSDPNFHTLISYKRKDFKEYSGKGRTSQ